MRRIWRLSAWPGLPGAGGLRTSGRWNPLGIPANYAAEHPAPAVLEAMAHLHLAMDEFPLTMKSIAIDVAEGAVISPPPVLPAGWQAREVGTQAVGGKRLLARGGLLLPLPSALVPDATDYLVNPRHAQASTHLAEGSIEPCWFDPRFIR